MIGEAPKRLGVGDIRIGTLAKDYVNECLDENRLSYGKFSRRFESEFAKLHGRRFACFVNSGTSALHIGLAALKERHGWKDGDSVLVPALTFVAGLNVVIQNNLHPILVDIRMSDFGMDPDHVAGIIGRHEAGNISQPAAIMPTHLFGRVSSPKLQAIARSFGIKILTDSCETMFVTGCAEGDVSCFSTYACHLINTGVGGFATTNDPDLAVLIRSLANHGRNGIYTGIDDALGVRETMDSRFTFDRPGYSYRATELEAAIGCAELERFGINLSMRKRNAEKLILAIQDLPLLLPNINDESAHMMLPILSEALVRDDLMLHLEKRGIETRPMMPLTNQPYVRDIYGKDIEDRFPVAKEVNARGFYVGCHPFITMDDVARMSEIFHEFYQ